MRNRESLFGGARVYVLTTTSGLAASMKIDEKRAIWRGLGQWVEERRGERAEMKAEVKDEDVKSEHEEKPELEGSGKAGELGFLSQKVNFISR